MPIIRPETATTYSDPHSHRHAPSYWHVLCGHLSIRPSELHPWLVDICLVRGLSWQPITSDGKDSTPVRDSLLGTALEKPHTIVLACALRSFEYSTE